MSKMQYFPQKDWPAQAAQQRVNNSPKLKPFYSIICEYNWPNLQEHINWVCTAPIADILDWAKGIQQDEAEGKEDNA